MDYAPGRNLKHDRGITKVKKGTEVTTCVPLRAIFSGLSKVSSVIIWQGKSERSDWFFLGRDFAIRTVSVETVI